MDTAREDRAPDVDPIGALLLEYLHANAVSRVIAHANREQGAAWNHDNELHLRCTSICWDRVQRPDTDVHFRMCADHKQH